MIVEARPVRAGEVAAAASTLAEGFLADPVMTHVLPDGARRFEQLRDVFGLVLEHGSIPDDAAWCDEQLRCVASWVPPDGRAASDARIAGQIDAFARALGDRLGEMARLEDAMAAVHPEEPHWYLAAVATEPLQRGRGLCRGVLTPILERCDTEGLAAYLESSNEVNVPLYERLGFEVTGLIRPWDGDGPALWPMWRDPRPPSG